MGALFGKLNAVKLMQRSDFIGAGRYWLRIDKIKKIDSRLKEVSVIIEMTCVAVIPSNEQPVHRIGDEVCNFIKVSGNEYAQKDMADFFCGALGCKTEELDPASLGFDPEDWALSDAQPMRGMVVEMDNRIRTLESGKLFTNKHTKREVPVTELLNTLPPEVANRFFPDNYLGKEAAKQAEATIAAAGGAVTPPGLVK